MSISLSLKLKVGQGHSHKGTRVPGVFFRPVNLTKSQYTDCYNWSQNKYMGKREDLPEKQFACSVPLCLIHPLGTPFE